METDIFSLSAAFTDHHRRLSISTCVYRPLVPSRGGLRPDTSGYLLPPTEGNRHRILLISSSHPVHTSPGDMRGKEVGEKERGGGGEGDRGGNDQERID